MSFDADVNIPDPININLTLPNPTNISADLGLEVDPNSKIDVGLSNIKVNPESKIDVGLNNIKVNPDSKIDIGLGNIRINPESRLELDIGLDNIRIKEIPEVATHIPVNLKFGIKLFGIEVLVLSLCGEVQFILEKLLKRFKTPEESTCDPCK